MSLVDPLGLKKGLCGSPENRECNSGDPSQPYGSWFGLGWNPFNVWFRWMGGPDGRYCFWGTAFLFNYWNWYGGGGGNGGFGIPVKRQFSKTFNCGSTASQVMGALENNFASFANNPASGQFSTFAIFPPGPVSTGQEIDINVGLQAFGQTIAYSDVSVTVQSETSDQLVFQSMSNHVLYPATVSFSASDAGNGSITFTTSVDATTNGVAGTVQFYPFGQAGETSTWTNLLNQVGKFCGN